MSEDLDLGSWSFPLISWEHIVSLSAGDLSTLVKRPKRTQRQSALMEIEDLLNEWKSFNLRDEEKGKALSIDPEEVEMIIKGQLDHCLIGKLLVKRNNIAVTPIKNALFGAWKTREDFSVQLLGKNTFLFKFGSQEDKNWVIKNGPWLFDKYLLILEVPSANQRTKELDFKKASFWLRLINLPLGYRNKTMARETCFQVLGMRPKSPID